MKISEAIPLDHPLDGDPEYCCPEDWDCPDKAHRFHFRPGAPKTPGDLIWCCCQSLVTTIEPG